MTFRIGMKVVCINSAGWFDASGAVLSGIIMPAFNGVYTIRGIRLFAAVGLGLVFEEILNPAEGVPLLEPHFFAGCFRPVIEKKTDISALLALQNPNNHTIPLPEDIETFERALLEIFDESFP